MRRTFSSLLLLTIVLFVGGLVWLLVNGHDSKPAVSLLEKGRQRPLSITGLVYDSYRNNKLATSIRAEQLQVKPRKFGIFRVRNLNEVSLKRTRFDLFQDSSVAAEGENQAQMSLTAGFAEGVNGLTGLRGMGQISRATIDSMSLNISRDGKPWLHLQARSAIFDLKKHLFDFNKARLLGPQKDFQLVTALLRWDEQQKIFHVPGDYRLITSEGIKQGSGAVVDDQFNVRPISKESAPVTRQ